MSGAIIILLAAVFLLAALSKLRSQTEFGEVLQNLVPTPLARVAASAIPSVELLLAAFLLSGIASQFAALVSAVVLGAFTVFLVMMWRRGVKGCGCFGEEGATAATGSGIIRNLLLIALAVFATTSRQAVLIYGPDVSTLLGRLTVVAGALCLWPCVVSLTDRRKLFFNVSKA